MMRLLAAALAALLTLVTLAACSPGTDGVGFDEVKLDVDTPALRAQKAEAGVEPCVQPTTDKHDHGDQGLPDVTLRCLGGGDDVDLARLRGPMVITFWANWCGPCARELPIFQRFAQKYDGQVGVLGIDYHDMQPSQALDLVRRSKVTFPLLADPNTDVTRAGLRVLLLPTLAFVDADGELTVWGDDARSPRVKAMEIESLAELEELAGEHLGHDVLVPAKQARAAKKKPAGARS